MPYVIDKDPFVSAWRGEEDGKTAAKALEKLKEKLNDCEEKIYITRETHKLYLRILDEVNNRLREGPKLFPSLKLYMYWVQSGKVKRINDSDLQQIDNEECLQEQEDIPFVRLAKKFNAVLVTRDENIQNCAKKIGYTVVTPEQLSQDP
ncbi:MAG: hypothetical protein QXV32_09535 [Conexivisphaerales archaeon]